MLSLFSEVRHGVRSLLRAPTFTTVAVLTLGCGLAGLTTVLTLLHALFFQRLPVERPSELVAVSATRQANDAPAPVSYPDYEFLRDRTKALSGLAAHYSMAPLFVRDGEEARTRNGAVVSANFFSLLAIEPARGRFFRPEEDLVPDRDRVVVLSYAYWRNRYHGDPSVVGKTVSVNEVAFEIVGVAPEAFRGITSAPVDLFLPTMMLGTGYRWCDDAMARGCTILSMIGRLSPGIGLEQARAELATLLPPGYREAPTGDNDGIGVSWARGAQNGAGERRLVGLLLLVSGVLLAVCGANLTGLLLARGTARIGEFALRRALGGSRGRLMRRVVIETMLLSLAGGAAGLAFSVVLTRWLNQRFYSADSAGRPVAIDMFLPPSVGAAVVLVALLTGMMFGLIAAIRVTRAGVGSVVRASRGSSPQGAGSSRRSGWLVGIQQAVAVALVAVTVLAVNGAFEVLRGSGFDPSGVALLRLRPLLIGYSPQQAQQLHQQLVAELAALPGVEAVGLTGTGSVLGGLEADISLGTTPGPAFADREPRPPFSVRHSEVGGRYFDAVSSAVLRGRAFDERDTATAVPVAMVSASLAKRLWPLAEPLGRLILVSGEERQVIGIVQDVAVENREEEARNRGVHGHLYLPYTQNVELVDARYAVRVAGNPEAALPSILAAVQRVDARVPISEVGTLTGQLAGSLRGLRLAVAVLGYAAALTVSLAALGLYGSLSLAVARRRREIGVRLAVGSEPAGIHRLIVVGGAKIVAVAGVVGALLALGSTRLLGHLLYGAGTTDLRLCVASALIVGALGIAASWIPARRAAAIDPLAVLRSE